MFRVNESEASRAFALPERAVQGVLLLALAGTLASAWSIRGEPLLLATTLLTALLLLFGLGAFRWLLNKHRASQGALRQLKMLAHDILASMNQGVVTTDRAGTITSINSAGINLLEVDFECVGRPLTAISPPSVSLTDIYREVVDGQAVVLDRDFSLDRAGRILRLRIDGNVLRDRQGTAIGCVLRLRDVTERMLLEERVARMERFLSLATLASGLHHEIKNPLTALSIHIQLLEEALADGQGGEAVGEMVGVLRTEVCRLNGVLENFRSFAHLQRLSISSTDALGVIENAIRLIRPQAAEQSVRITLLHPETELPRVPLDADKFEQAVLNLVLNALEAMPAGGTLTISAAVLDGELRVSVKDSGPGIPAEVRPHLFRPYFSTKTRGSGMGLALSEKLIDQHGGRIDYRTGPEGTTFDITVPLQQRNGQS
jgi:signal transduction histidine kinase